MIRRYFFNPLCGFKKIGSSFNDIDDCNICYCSLDGAVCTLKSCSTLEEETNKWKNECYYKEEIVQINPCEETMQDSLPLLILLKKSKMLQF